MRIAIQDLIKSGVFISRSPTYPGLSSLANLIIRAPAAMDCEYKIEEGDLEVIHGAIIRKADGTAVRKNIPSLPPSPDRFVHGVASKDVIVDPETGLWARLFVPETPTDKYSKKLPVVLFIHGGGFCIAGPGAIGAVNDCTRVCREANCVVVSSSYRLAPEHRLPAAYDDAYNALLWLQKQAMNWDTTPSKPNQHGDIQVNYGLGTQSQVGLEFSSESAISQSVEKCVEAPFEAPIYDENCKNESEFTQGKPTTLDLSSPCKCLDAYIYNDMCNIPHTTNIRVVGNLPASAEDMYKSTIMCKHQDTADAEACEPWLKKHADFSRLFLMGQSAGGNIAHHLMVLKPMHELHPLSIKGLIIEVPSFNAEVSESEALSSNSPTFPLANQRAMWLMCLPVGANRDHPYCNVFAPDAPNLSEVQFPRILLVYGGQDVLRTRQMQYYDALKKAGKDVTIVEVPEGKHLFRLDPLLEAENVRVDKAISEFINAGL